MTYNRPQCKAQGEAAVVAYFGQGIGGPAGDATRALTAYLSNNPLAGQKEATCAYASVQVQFDPLQTDHQEISAGIIDAATRMDAIGPGDSVTVEVPVSYGGDEGPDIGFVAKRCGFSQPEVIARHCGTEYLCHFVGFTPGFPYLGGLKQSLACPRLDAPRIGLPAGSVGIGGVQTGLYPLGGPGGWRVIGRTPLLAYDPWRDPVCLIRAGDKVRFIDSKAEGFPIPPQPENLWDSDAQPVFEVLHPGGMSLIQDSGRWGSQKMGIALSGALDQTALTLANSLVGNHPDAAALEMTLIGPKLRVLRDITVAVCGSDLGPRIDYLAAGMWSSMTLEEGQILSFSGPMGGARAILAVSGGLAAKPWRGSRSAFPAGLVGATLAKGDVLHAHIPDRNKPRAMLPKALQPPTKKPIILRAVPGPNDDLFLPSALRSLVSKTFEVGNRSDRRGIRLNGEIMGITSACTAVISEPVTPGVIQIPAGGQPVVLMREQTVGGYAKLATIIGPDLDLLANAKPGDEVRFRLIGAEQAIRETRAHHDNLRKMIKACTQ